MKAIGHLLVTRLSPAPRQGLQESPGRVFSADPGPDSVRRPKTVSRTPLARFVNCPSFPALRILCLGLAVIVLAGCAATREDGPDRSYVAGAALRDMPVSSFEEQMLREINRVRRLHGLPQVYPDQHLNDLARGHAKSMLARGHADHEGLHERFVQSGRHLCVENAAFYFKDPVLVVKAWMESPGHKKNLLHPDITHVGLAQVEAYTEFFGCQ